MYIAFKPKETLDEFADRFYIEGQQLITSKQLQVKEVYTTCANALKVNQLLSLHFKACKVSLTSMKSIKTLLQDMHLTHPNPVVREAKSSTPRYKQTPQILALASSGKPKRQGCHNCDVVGHHSRVCPNPKV